MPRLLLVEDEQVNRELFRRRLERKGYSVVAAEDGLSAVALTRTEKPDLVLMDLGLPDIDGWEATQRIKADPATAAIPVVVLSAHATTEARDKAFAAGCEEFETKPVNWEALFKKIDGAINKALERAKAAAAPRDEIDLGASTPDSEVATDVIRRPRRPKSADASTLILPAVPPKPKNEEKELCAVQRKHVLVVEDNDANRTMLCRRLNRHGYETTEAANGRQAIRAVRERRFDLVLCDIVLPEVDGFGVLCEMKSEPDLESIPVIMISALDETAAVVRCIEMGAEDYVQKPYEPVLLFARIHACLDKRRLRDQERAYLGAVDTLVRAAELIEQGTFDPALLAAVAARDDALGTLARVFDRMAREVRARVQQLQSAVQRLTAGESAGKEHARSTAPESKANDETVMIPPLPKPK
jgi:CheY-like chemotaxis protein